MTTTPLRVNGAPAPASLTPAVDQSTPAPKITMAGILAKVKRSTYTLLDDKRTTICQITLENGYTIIGKSACVSLDNYNQGLGEQYAYEDALNNVWILEGYLLQERLYQALLNQLKKGEDHGKAKSTNAADGKDPNAQAQ